MSRFLIIMRCTVRLWVRICGDPLKIWEKQALKDYRVEFVRYDKIGTVEEAMTIFFELHQKRQMAKGNCGVFSDGDKKSFHTDVANAFAEKGWIGLFFLTFNDRHVSAVYSYEYNGKLYAYLCGFDPEYARYRPGYLVFKNLIKYGIDKKLKELDFFVVTRSTSRGGEQWSGIILNLGFQKGDLRADFTTGVRTVGLFHISTKYLRSLRDLLQKFSKMLFDKGIA